MAPNAVVPPRGVTGSVFITGASSGLGAALARRYAASGVAVGLFARRRAELDSLAASLPAGGIL